MSKRIDVTSCTNCPMAGFTTIPKLYLCGARKSPPLVVLLEAEGTPDSCPLREGNITLSIQVLTDEQRLALTIEEYNKLVDAALG